MCADKCCILTPAKLSREVVHPVKEIRGWHRLSTGWIEWTENNDISRLRQEVRQLDFRARSKCSRSSCGNQLSAERLDPQAPGWAAQENEKDALLWPEELVGVNMLQSLFSLQLTSHAQPFQLSERYIFLKNCARSSLLRRYVSARICACIVGCDCTTQRVNTKRIFVLDRNTWNYLALCTKEALAHL